MFSKNYEASPSGALLQTPPNFAKMTFCSPVPNSAFLHNPRNVQNGIISPPSPCRVTRKAPHCPIFYKKKLIEKEAMLGSATAESHLLQSAKSSSGNQYFPAASQGSFESPAQPILMMHSQMLLPSVPEEKNSL